MKKGLVLVLCLMLLFSTAAAMAETTITARGSGSVSMDPDRATVTLGVSQMGKNVAEAQSDVNGRIAAIRKAMKGMKLSEDAIAVSDISIYPQYDYSGNEEMLIGYSVSQDLSITLEDPSHAGEVIDSALKAGANRLNGVNFFLSDTESAYLTALGLAVENAAGRARAMADAAGLKLGTLTDISETESYGGFNTYASVSMSLADTEASGAVPTELDAGKVTVSASVTAAYEAN